MSSGEIDFLRQRSGAVWHTLFFPSKWVLKRKGFEKLRVVCLSQVTKKGKHILYPS